MCIIVAIIIIITWNWCELRIQKNFHEQLQCKLPFPISTYTEMRKELHYYIVYMQGIVIVYGVAMRLRTTGRKKIPKISVWFLQTHTLVLRRIRPLRVDTKWHKRFPSSVHKAR